MREKFDISQLVTDKIIAELEKGIIPWDKPWMGTRSGAFNRISKKPYSFINQMMLKHRGEYATFKQWTDLGGKIKKGEKSEIVVFWKMLQVENKKEKDENGRFKMDYIPMLRYINVFHISQVEGVEPLEKPFKDVELIDEADKIINDYIDREGIHFSEEPSNRAYYNRLLDEVVVPMKEQFKLINEYYSTTFHELTHSTGHKNRLNRFSEKSLVRFGDSDYSKEELVAEIGASAMLNILGIETEKTFRNSTAYIQSWLTALKNDKKMIVSASGKAQKAVEYILGTNVEEVIAEA